MNVDFVSTPAIQNLLDRASGKLEQQGDARLKLILRDLLEAAMQIIVRHDVSESEFWGAAKYLADGAGEIGLIIPGIGLEHFMDLYLDAKDEEAGRSGGTRAPSKARSTWPTRLWWMARAKWI
jgi:catechol 1,2-dioxygenase